MSTWWLLSVCQASAETKQVKSPSRLVALAVEAPEGVDVDWEARQPITQETKVFRTTDGLSVCVFFLGQPEVVISSDKIDWEQRKRTKDLWIVTLEGEPVPPTPVPVPPDVDPQPDLPFPAPGLTVLMLREASDIGSLPPEQQAIFTSYRIVNYCRDHCVRLEDGQPAVRIWDDDYTDAQLARVPPVLRVAYANTKQLAAGRLPWIAISNGSKGFSGPLPASTSALLALLEQFGG